MNPTNPTLVSSSRNSQARFRLLPFTAGRAGKLGSCLILGVASLCASVQAQTLVDKTPVLHLSFDNVSGSTVINDGSGGSGMNGTLNGSAGIVSGGMFGNCLQISGSSASDASCRIANAVVPLTVTNAWTVAMWIQTYTSGGCYAYQGDGGWGPNNTSFYLNNGNGGGTRAGGVRYGTGWEEGSTDINDGAWHHLVMTCSNGTKTLYLDGNVDAFAAAGYAGDGWTTVGAGSQFWIGGNGYNGDGSACLNGLIDEVYVFNTALSLSDIQGLTNNVLPVVPVAVTVNPASGFRGQVITVTATATPAAGTATNATADLSALGLSSTANLVLSTTNVFTNSFTVPLTAPVGGNLVKATVIDTEPLVGSGGATFTVVPRPPTNGIVVTDITNTSVYAYAEASFHFAATNDAPNDASYPMTYAWYKGGQLVSTNPMGPDYTFLTTPGDNGTNIYAIASVADTNYSSITITSAVVTLTVNSGVATYTNGLKRELFANVTRQQVEIGDTAAGRIDMVSAADIGLDSFNGTVNYIERLSGWFIPPADGTYVFFINSDDDSDLFLSTDANPTNKVLIAQETVWSGAYQWLSAGGGGSVSQKRSDQFSPDGGYTTPYAAGFNLSNGVPYYIEAVHHQGSGGANLGITYDLTNDLYSTTYDSDTDTYTNSSIFANGALPLLNATNNNIALATKAPTFLTWAPDLTPTAVTVSEGATTNFTCLATSDAEMVWSYQWYLNNAPFPGATGTNLILASIPFSYNAANIQVVVSNEEGGLVITSRVATLTVVQAVHENGFIKDERWDNKTVSDIENNNVSLTPDHQMAITEWEIGIDNADEGHYNFARRVSGYFIPPATANYVFYITSDDDSYLFVSTDETSANKREVCQQDYWNNGGLNWQSYPGWVGWYNPANNSCSATYNSAFASGILLTQGQRYYIEQDMNQGGGGANLGVTYTYYGDSVPATGTETQLKGTNIQMNVNRCTYVAFTKQPVSVATAVAGTFVAFSADGTTDSQLTIGGITGYEEDFANNHLFYQWFTNDVPVSGANSKKFFVGPLTTDDAGMRVVCKVRALGYTDDSLNPIWSNSVTATITAVVPQTPGLLGHFISGPANLNDTANYVAPGLYYGVPARATTSSQLYYFTNDVPPSAPAGAQSLYIQNDAIAITNTCTSDPGYVVDTFDGNMANQFTVMCWAKGSAGGWQAFVTKGGDSGIGWALRTGYGNIWACWTLRGTGQNDDMQAWNSIPDGNWHHIAGTYSVLTGNRILYVDGVQVASEAGNTEYTPAAGHVTLGTEDLNPGNNYGNNGYLTGELYDVRIYNYELSQAEVAAAAKVVPKFTTQITNDGNGNQQLQITWPFGTLLQATNLTGPWTTNSTVSPATINIDPTQPQVFFKVSNP